MGVLATKIASLLGIKGRDGSTVASASNPFPSSDTYQDGEVLADQSGADGVLTFTFSSAVDLVWVRADGGDARADPFGGTPAASTGIKCEDGIPNPLTIETTAVKVYAATGTTVGVWGFRYG